MPRVILCPKCHQPLRFVRAGVPLGAVKARIFDLIQAAGDLGLNAQDLIFHLSDVSAARSPHTIKAHIYQMNEQLAGTDVRIVRESRRYCLVVRRRGAVA